MDTTKSTTILASDCGSTTTKARLFRKIGKEYRFICTGEAPTTVEAPYEDVTMGVRNAVREIEELSGIKLLESEQIKIRKSILDSGCDLYVTTSSAGGGLQMVVFGVTKTITAESAERAALGGGAIVMDVISVDDAEPILDKVQKVRFLRPDMVLMAGGTDGGSVAPVVSTAEIIRIAEPRARFGDSFSLPVIFAGNKNARKAVSEALKDKVSLQIVDNLRPTVSLENTDPARDTIQVLFMEHVMSHAPGYTKLMKWTSVPIMPTPRGEGLMFQTCAKMYNINMIGVGLGGATTNVYSIFDEKFVRTVSANLGMSYSISNVLKETGMKNILRWIPFEIDHKALGNILTDKMIRPTTIPQTLNELVIEHAVAREALRLGFIHHKFLARGLRGARPAGSLDTLLDRKVEGLRTYIDMLRVDMIGGTGGLLSHAPRRVQSALMLIDGFQPEGITRLVQDSVFMMPHLGVLSTVYPEEAMEIFDKDCLIRLGTCIAPRGVPEKEGDEVLNIEFTFSSGSSKINRVILGEILRVPLTTGAEAKAVITPNKNCDIGAGPGKQLTTTIQGGEAGVFIDGRGRPLQLSEDRTKAKTQMLKWYAALDLYPSDAMREWAKEGN